MIDLKILRAQIKEALDSREKAAEILSFIGYSVDRNFKFKLRDESTPSASINRDGNIKDFGDGWYGDVVAVLHEHHGKTLKDATLYIADCLGVRYE